MHQFDIYGFSFTCHNKLTLLYYLFKKMGKLKEFFMDSDQLMPQDNKLPH